MKKKNTVITALILLFPFIIFSQQAFDDGEYFKFRVHYGLLNAGYATMEVNETLFNNRETYHIVGKGYSTGVVHAFFKVRDNYETFMDKSSGLPQRFIRQINEGGYTKDYQLDFNQDANKVFVKDNKKKENHTFTTSGDVHDMLSAFYFLRNDLNKNPLQPGQEYQLNMFYDTETHDFKLKFLGREIIKTKFGKIATLKFRPYVLAGRVFEEKESLTFWVSDDKNKIPVKISASLAVGSLDASLDEFKGLKHPLQIIMD